MFKRIRKTHHKCRQAFTLVELIVVLVILAILAAIIVPALTGYIKNAKRQKYVQKAEEARLAAQAVMTELYGLGGGAMTNELSSGSNPASGGGEGGDVRWDDQQNTHMDKPEEVTKLKWGNKVLELMSCSREEEPYILIFGVGHSQATNLTLAQKYTVYYVAYVDNKNAPAIFYINGKFSYQYPKDDGSLYANGTGVNKNIMKVENGDDIPLQLYVVSTYKVNNFWTGGKDTLQGHSEPKNKK